MHDAPTPLIQPRIAPLEPPYEPEVTAELARWMPPGVAAPPLAIFRTLARHRLLGERMRGLGAMLLGKGTVPPRARELIILRTCARAGAEYEWGVHVTAFAAAVGLDEEAVRATTSRFSCVTEDGDDALLLRFADELHDTSTLSDALWPLLASRWTDEHLLELIAIAGFYHLIAYTVNAAGLPLEPWAARLPT